MDYCCSRQHAQPAFVHTHIRYNLMKWDPLVCSVYWRESTCLTIHHNLRTRAHTQTHTRTVPFTLEWTFIRAPSIPIWLYLRHVSSFATISLCTYIWALRSISLLTHLVQIENEKENNSWTMFLSPRAHRYMTIKERRAEPNTERKKKCTTFQSFAHNIIYYVCISIECLRVIFFGVWIFFLFILSDMIV